MRKTSTQSVRTFVADFRISNAIVTRWLAVFGQHLAEFVVAEFIHQAIEQRRRAAAIDAILAALCEIIALVNVRAFCKRML